MEERMGENIKPYIAIKNNGNSFLKWIAENVFGPLKT